MDIVTKDDLPLLFIIYTENQELSWSQLFRHRWLWRLSLRQPPMSPVTTKLVIMTSWLSVYMCTRLCFALLFLCFVEVMLWVIGGFVWLIHLYGCEATLSNYCDVIMGTMASLITSLTIVYSTLHSGADQRKHQGSASLAFVWGIHRRPVNSPHKWPVTRKMFPFDDNIMGYRKIIPYLTTTLNRKCHFDDIFITGCTESCQSCQNVPLAHLRWLDWCMT